MKKFKRALITMLAFVLGIAVAIAGAYAYFTDSESDVNVATVGKISVDQLEYERVVNENGKWVESEYEDYGYTADLMQPYTQRKDLLPKVGDTKWDDRNGSQAASGEGSHQQVWAQVGAPGSNQLFDDDVKNVVDKFVFVKNTGANDLYYRTIIAIENPEGAEGLIGINKNGNSRFDWNQNEDGVQSKAEFISVVIDGVQYAVAVATYNEVLTPGEVSRPSLLQYYMKSEATQEQAALFGDTVDILVFTQAVQADGWDNAKTALDTAFGGAISEKNHPWSDSVIVGNDESSDKINSTNVAGKITTGGIIEDLTILDNTTDKYEGGKYFRALYGNGITEDLTVENSYLQGLYAMNVTAKADAGVKLTANDTTFDGWVSYSGWETATFTDCTFIGEKTHSDYAEPWIMSQCRVQTYNDTTFNNCNFGPNFAISNADACTITINNCYKEGVKVTAENFNELLNNTDLNGDYCMTDDEVDVIVDGETVEIPTVVSNADDLAKALEAGEDIVLAKDIVTDEEIVVFSGDVEINLNGKTIESTAEL